MTVTPITDQPASIDVELRALAERLEWEARLWHARGFWAVADQLRQAAVIARGWVGVE